MSNIHHFQRYSQPENVITNNTLQLFARIYAHSPVRASQLLTELTGEPIEIGIEVQQQKSENNSVPDGCIIQRSFKLVIEAKNGAAVNVDQLMRHTLAFSDEKQKILLLVTRELVDSAQKELIHKKLVDKHAGVIFKNITFEEICDAVRPLFKEYEDTMYALADDYIRYCNDTGLFDQAKYLLRIVPCGQSLALNREFGIYFHPSDRGYTRHRFIGIYKDKVVQAIWKIDSIFDVEFDGQTLKRYCVEGVDNADYDEKLIHLINRVQEDLGWDISYSHRFFCGKPFATGYRKVSPYGIQGARFVNLKAEVGDLDDAQAIASALSTRTWE